MGFILTVLSALLLTAANYYGGLYFLSWTALFPFFYYIFIIKFKYIVFFHMFFFYFQ
jgi:apolipoprotein N-acyltransferase